MLDEYASLITYLLTTHTPGAVVDPLNVDDVVEVLIVERAVGRVVADLTVVAVVVADLTVVAVVVAIVPEHAVRSTLLFFNG